MHAGWDYLGFQNTPSGLGWNSSAGRTLDGCTKAASSPCYYLYQSLRLIKARNACKSKFSVNRLFNSSFHPTLLAAFTPALTTFFNAKALQHVRDVSHRLERHKIHAYLLEDNSALKE